MNQIVLPDTGATIKPGPMVTVVGERTVTDADLAGFAEDSGLNAPFLADQLSAWITHQRMGGNLFRMLERRTANIGFKGMYKGLVTSGEQATTTYETLITSLGGNPQYASPAARMHEGMDAKIVESLLLPGSADPLSLETAGLTASYSALVLAALHAETLVTFADKAKDGAAKTAMVTAAERLLPVCSTGLDQVRAAIDTSMTTQASSAVAQKAMQVMEKATGAVRDKLR